MNEELLKQMYDLNQAMGEAGGIAFCELWGVSTDEDGVRHNVKINVTARDLNSLSALRQLMETIKVAKEEYKLKPYQPSFGSVSKPAEQKPAVQDAPKPAVQEAPKPAAPARPAPSTEGANMFHCVKIAVAPYKDKIKIDWFAQGRKYAELTSYIPVEQAVAWFQPFGLWTHDHFEQVAEYTVDMNIYWKESEKLNSKGNPYKNIVKMEAA